MANLDGGNFNKFLVLKHSDIDDVIEDKPYLGMYIDELCDEVRDYLKKKGKTTLPTYLVINTDESYADEIIDILKRNGHWG